MNERAQFPFHMPEDDSGNDLNPVGNLGRYPPGPVYTEQRRIPTRQGIPVVIAVTPPPKNMGQRREGIISDVIATVATLECERPQNMVALVRTIPVQELPGATSALNPYMGVVWGGVLPADLLQTAVMVGILTTGHDGVSFRTRFNLPTQNWIRAPFAGSSGKVDVRLEPRYYPMLPDGADFTWISTDDETRNAAFSEPPQNVLSANGPPAGWPVAFPAQAEGYFAEGVLNSGTSNQDRGSRPLRRFFGWVAAATAGGVFHKCPIPFGAQSVTLVCDATAEVYDPAGGAAGQPLRFAQRVGTQRRIYNFLPNVTYPIRSDAVAIDVYGLVAAAAGKSIPFELVYDLGF